MKFTIAWEKVIKENMHLKIMVLVLVVTTVILLIAATILALKPPVLIERGCYSTAAKLGEEKQTPNEYESFLKTALEQRFNTDTEIIEGYLEKEQKRIKENEQKALEKNNLSQTILVRKVQFQDNLIFVDLDRTYSIKNVRSTLATKLKVTLETKSRTSTNPYGLILMNTEEVKEKKDNENESNQENL